MLAPPLAPEYEMQPDNPLRPDFVPPGSRTHRVRDGEDFRTVAAKYGIDDPWELIYYNFRTRDVKAINWYLRERVGCKVPTPDFKNWRFTSSADPGIIYIPPEERKSTLAGVLEKTWAGVGTIFVPKSGSSGPRVEIFKLANVEQIVRTGAANSLDLLLEYTIKGIETGVSTQQAIIVATGINDPAKQNGMVLLERQVKINFSAGYAAVRGRVKQAVQVVKDVTDSPGEYFSRRDFGIWMKQLGVLLDTPKPHVDVLAEAAFTGLGATADHPISRGSAQIIGVSGK